MALKRTVRPERDRLTTIGSAISDPVEARRSTFFGGYRFYFYFGVYPSAEEV